MSKVIVIDDCDDCKFVYFYLGADACCRLMNRRRCYDDLNENENLPNWCPLQEATENIIKLEQELMKKANYVIE